MKSRLKKWVSRAVFWFLARGLNTGSILDSGIRQEVSQWGEDSRLTLQIMPFGPCVTIIKQANRLIRSKSLGTAGENDLVISFKNMEGALLVLLGRMSAAQAFAEHRIIMKGDIAKAMSVVRCIDRVENYLFPSFITGRILRKRPHKEVSSLRVYLHILVGI